MKRLTARALALILAILALSLPAAAATDAASRTSFTWGGDIGGAVDMSGHDMSTINIDAYFGLHCPAFRVLGIGAGINMPVDNSYRTFPLYAIAQTSFVGRPQPMFADVRVGCVFNEHPRGESSTDFYCSPGVGFRLAEGKRFASYMVVGYIYNGMHGTHYVDDTSRAIHGIHSAVIRLGIRF